MLLTLSNAKIEILRLRSLAEAIQTVCTSHRILTSAQMADSDDENGFNATLSAASEPTISQTQSNHSIVSNDENKSIPSISDENMAVFDRVLDKYRENENELYVRRADQAERSRFWSLPVVSELSESERDAISSADEEQTAKLLRADCIRQTFPWDAPGTDQEVLDEIIAQLKLVTQAPIGCSLTLRIHGLQNQFLLLDYYIKLLRPYSALWNTPEVEPAVVDAVKLVGDACKVMSTLKLTIVDTYKAKHDGHFKRMYEPRAGEWAHRFFEYEQDALGDKFAESAAKRAVDQFLGICERIIAANHNEEGLCRKRNRKAFEAGNVDVGGRKL